MNRIRGFCGLLILSLAGPGSAQTGNAGATGLAFLKIGVGARANAMGEAYTAVVSDATATFWNPAGLSRLQRGHVSFTHSEWIQDVSSEFLAVAFPAFGGVTGISANLSSVGSIERRVSTGESLGDLEWNDFALGVSYGRSISENLGVGVTAKYLYQKIYLDSASGYAFDLGFSFRPFANAITLALVAQNLGSVNELKAESSELPRTLRLGGSYVLGLPSLDGALVVAVDGVKIAEQDLRAHFGAEFQLKSMLALRMGYQAGYDEKSFGGGFGLTFQRYHLDYGYTPFGSNLGDTHRFSFGLDL